MNFIRLSILIIVVLQLVACEKVIDVDIREADEKYVIEGIIDDQGTCKVMLTKTIHFNEPSIFPVVTGAVVTITDNGTPHLLTETAPGFYESVTLSGTPGHQYDLVVKIGSETFSARCNMLPPVPIDTLYIAYGPFGSFKFPHVQYKDPATIDNAYRFIQYKNRIKDPAIFWDNDEFTNGQTTILRLDNGVTQESDPRVIQTGDTVTIELLSLDDPIYRFWSTVLYGGAAGSAFTASPANPLTNIKGGALGYFSAHSVTRRTVVSW